MYRHFLRDKAAARVQQRDWEKSVKLAARTADFISKPCPYCGTPMTMRDGNHASTSESDDHITPRCKGGTAIAVVCIACNQDKHHLSLSEYRAVLCVRRRTFHVFYFERLAVKMLISRLLSTACHIAL